MDTLNTAPDERLDALQLCLETAEGAVVLSLPRWAASLDKRRASKPAPLPRKVKGTLVAVEPSWSMDQLEQAFERLAAAPTNARLVLGFRNAAGASNLVDALAGRAPVPGWSEAEVLDRAARHGLGVVTRRGFALPTAAGLAKSTERSLKGLFAQLNPSSLDDWVLLWLAPSHRRERVQLVPGLLSVVMRNHSLKREQLLDQAIFSLAAQAYQPLEIVIVTQSLEASARERLEAILERHRRVGGFTSRVVMRPSSEDIRAQLVNVGLSEARGQYVAFLDDDDVIYPNHYHRLIEALAASDRAWAFSSVRRAYFSQLEDGTLYCKKKDVFPRSGALDLARLMHDNYVTCHSYVIDRERLGKFELGFEERLDKGEDYTMLLRLLALFRPLALGGAPTAEYRIRDNGSNTIVHDTADLAARAGLQKQWETAIELKNRLTADLQVLLTKEEFVTETRKGVADDDVGEPEELRYRLADFANSALKRGLPFVHSRVKAGIETRLQREEG